MDTLISTEWLARHLEDPDLVVLDCSVNWLPDPDAAFGVRIICGRPEYEKGHIPGAGFADLTSELCDRESAYSFAVPSPEAFCNAMGALGVGDECRVVLYDSFSSGWASRVWWMLRWVGFDNAAVLDGGLGAWKSEDRPLSVQPVAREARTLTPAPRSELIVDRDEVFAAIEDERVAIIDALPLESFRGDYSAYGRPGHIPTACNVSSMDLLDEAGRFRDAAELATMFDGDKAQRTLVYCGGGIAASADAFIMTRLGFSDVAVYAASLQEWVSDASNPLVVGV